MRRRTLTVGHSNRSGDEFVELLRVHGVRFLADIRRFPRSRRHPWFDSGPLAAELNTAGIAYRHFEPLGGYREERPDSPHTGLEGSMLRGYADHMGTPEFEAAVVVLEEWAAAGDGELSVMCAEADPAHCHRSLLSDALLSRGNAVEHILEAGARRAHTLTPWARVEGGRLFYESGVLRLPGL